MNLLLRRSSIITKVPRNFQFLHRSPLIDAPVKKVKNETGFAYNDVYDYPKDYQPWSFNYTGHGYFVALTALGLYINYQYESLHYIMTEQPRMPKDQYKR